MSMFRFASFVARPAGRVLAVVFGTLGRLRHTRALHPVGVCGTGLLTVSPAAPSGMPLLDSPGPHPCLLRWSRATGLRHGPDIEGLAIRLQGPAAGDVLLASTGTGVVGRHLLTLRGAHRHGPLTTLLPLQTGRGSMLLRLDPDPTEGATPPVAYRFFVAAPGHPWHERGRLRISWTDYDCTRRHDPVGQPPTGSWVPPGWAALRAASYVRAQAVPARPEPADKPPASGAATNVSAKPRAGA